MTVTKKKKRVAALVVMPMTIAIFASGCTAEEVDWVLRILGWIL